MPTGIAPPELDTPIGQFRQNTNDLVYEELDPPVVGEGEYRYNSDDEIQSWLDQSDESVYRAVGYYFEGLAGEASVNATVTKDYDLSVDLDKRAARLQEQADRWFKRADEEDGLAGFEDILEIVNVNGSKCSRCPEAAPCVVCCAPTF